MRLVIHSYFSFNGPGVEEYGYEVVRYIEDLVSISLRESKSVGKNFLVRKGGLEPPHLSVPDPKSGASANSATFALLKPVLNSREQE